MDVAPRHGRSNARRREQPSFVVPVLVVGALLAGCGGGDRDDSGPASTGAPSVESIATSDSLADSLADPSGSEAVDTSTSGGPDDSSGPDTIGGASDSPDGTEAPPIGWFSFGGTSFFEVPELGATDIRGSGCGSGVGDDPALDDRVPDGLWFGSLGPKYENYEPIDENDLGYAYNRFDGTTLEIDLWCVYSGATAEQKYLSEACRSDTVCEANNSTGWLTEDDSDRMRSLPVADDYVYRVDYYEAEAGWDCMWTDPFEVDAAWRRAPVWIAVNQGRVTEVFGHCAYWLESSEPR